MNDSAAWLAELARATAVLSLSVVIVAALLRLLRITSPAVHRLAYGLVLVQGWLVVRPTIELPWRDHQPIAVTGGAGTDATIADLPAVAIIAPAADEIASPPGATAANIAKTPPTASEEAAAGAALPAPQANGKGAWNAQAEVVLAVWLFGALATVVFLIGSYGRFLRKLGTTLPIAAQWLDEWRQALAERPVKRPIELRVTAATGPLVCWTPRGYRVLVPESLWNGLSAPQRLAVLRHELAHCRRGDLWKSLAVRLLAALHWFNPFAWWAARRFDEAAEWACDALAPQSATDRVEYAKVLLHLCRPTTARSSLAAAIGGRAMAARVRRVLFAAGGDDATFKKLAFVCGMLALVVCGWVRIELIARLSADEPAAQLLGKAPEVVDVSSLIDVLARHEARFGTFHIEYVSTERREDDEGNPLPDSEDRVEFARDAQAGRWFRKATTLTGGVRTQQVDRYTDQSGKRAIESRQTNWNGMNPPHVAINQPRNDGYDAEPLFGLFFNSTPISAHLKGRRVSVAVVDGDALLRWATTAGPFTYEYQARLSHEHGLLPIEFQCAVDGPIDVPQTTQWRATRVKQAGDVWYAAEGEIIKTHLQGRQRFKVARLDFGQPISDEAIRYEIPAGSWVHDGGANKLYIHARPSTDKTKPFSVTVLDVGGRPIEEASVKISLSQAGRDQAGKPPQMQFTNKEGVARFDAVSDDMLYVEVSKPDLRPAAIISGGGNQLRLYLTPRTKGQVIDIDGRKPSDGYVVVPSFGLDMSGGTLKPRPAHDRDSCAIGPGGAFVFTKELTLRRIDLPLLFVAYSEAGQRMAIQTIMPEELSNPLDFLLEPAAPVIAELQLPPGTPRSTRVEVIWTDAEGRMIGSSAAMINGNSDESSLRGTAVGQLPPGDYQLQIRATSEMERLVFDFAVSPDQMECALGVIPLRPSKFASLRGKPAPELVGGAIPPNELKPLRSLRGRIVVLNFWHLYPEQFNYHPEQTPFFTLPAQFKDKPVHWIAIHDQGVSNADRLAAKVAEMRNAIWGEEPAPFTALIDAAEPIPEGERAEEGRRATDGWRPGTTQGVTAARYGVFARLVLIDRQGRVVGSYTQEELEPALRRLLEAGS